MITMKHGLSLSWRIGMDGEKRKGRKKGAVFREIFSIKATSRGTRQEIFRSSPREGSRCASVGSAVSGKTNTHHDESHVSNANAWHLRCNNSRTRRKAVIRELQPAALTIDTGDEGRGWRRERGKEEGRAYAGAD